MSRTGKAFIAVPPGVDLAINGQDVVVKGKLGQLQRTMHENVQVSLEGGRAQVRPVGKSKELSALWGMSRAMLANMVTGVSVGFSKTLNIIGVGYKAAVNGGVLKLTIGYSHDVDYKIPEGIKITVDRNTFLVVSGVDKEAVGRACADIRAYRSPEPYKGKGIRYVDEFVPQKVGKKK